MWVTSMFSHAVCQSGHEAFILCFVMWGKHTHVEAASAERRYVP
jgi:hypothetical protein